MPYAVGQRWISNTEHELGLGTILQIDTRTVHLRFVAGDEDRVYTKENAPITRVIIHPGDEAKCAAGWSITVANIKQENGVLTYIGTRTDTKEEVELREIMLDHQIRFNKPQDKLFAGQIGRMNNFTLRYRALFNQLAYNKSELIGLQGVRANLIEHQLYVAHEVGKRFAPRVLLADEVGLGKTIEAGMIIQQQLLSNRAQRVLIIVPETLIHQWLVEMLRRFNLHFSIFDEERCIELVNEAFNPFDTEQLVLCSLDFIEQNPSRLEELKKANWDLLVVDEAHHLEWSPTEISPAYNIVETLAKVIPGVLLLTATPEQLGHASHFARLRLLDPDRFFNYENFLAEEAQYKPVADAITQLIDNKKLSNETVNKITEILGAQDIEPELRIINSETTSASEKTKARSLLTSHLMDRHGTGRILFRNTRNSVTGFSKRCANFIGLDMPQQYKTARRVFSMLYTNLTQEEKLSNYLYPEELFQAIEGKDSSWWKFDPRIDWLIEFLKNNRNKKVLLICAKANSALQIEQALREREGLRATVFHEGMSIIDRDKAAAYFAEEETGAQILLCSEIGSEGRNFQFANQLVMFDMPLNPDLLEQRIGRLDRIGQTSDIDIHVPYLEGSAQAVLALWYNRALNAFNETCPTGRIIFNKTYPQLKKLMLARSADMEVLANIIESGARENALLKEQMEQGRDRLLELNSNGGEQAAKLVTNIAAQDNDPNLIQFAISLFDIIGLNQHDVDSKVIKLRPSEHMLVPSYPGLAKDGANITFDRNTALSREDLQFVTWEHPIIQGGFDIIFSEDIGASSVALFPNNALSAGTMFLELIYVVSSQVPKSTGINRYLPATPIRILLDAKGNNLATQVDFDGFNQQLKPINRQLASKLAASVQNQVRALIKQGDAQAKPLMDEIKQSAEDDMNQQLRAAYNRLFALKAVNPNIRTSELEQIEEQIKTLSAAIKQAQVSLDSLRLIVSAPKKD